jgi:molybdopterin-guanine dinucleotide biosynthesis protein A
MKGVVLTGGASSRMGRDKALVEVDGTAMAVRVATALRAGGCDEVWCQGGDIAALAAAGLDVVPDDHPGQGPLPAIATALATAAPDSIVVSACDLADLDAATVSMLIAAAGASPEADVVAAIDRAGPHLLSVWNWSAASALELALESGVRSYRQMLERLRVIHVEVPWRVVRNVNTPGDLPGRG